MFDVYIFPSYLNDQKKKNNVSNRKQSRIFNLYNCYHAKFQAKKSAHVYWRNQNYDEKDKQLENLAANTLWIVDVPHNTLLEQERWDVI